MSAVAHVRDWTQHRSEPWHCDDGTASSHKGGLPLLAAHASTDMQRPVRVALPAVVQAPAKETVQDLVVSGTVEVLAVTRLRA